MIKHTKLKIIIGYDFKKFEEDVNVFCSDKKVISIQCRKGNEDCIEQGNHFAYIVYQNL